MKRNIALMYAIALFQGMVFYAPVATRYRQAQGVSLFQITIIESVSLALCIVLASMGNAFRSNWIPQNHDFVLRSRLGFQNHLLAGDEFSGISVGTDPSEHCDDRSFRCGFQHVVSFLSWKGQPKGIWNLQRNGDVRVVTCGRCFFGLDSGTIFLRGVFDHPQLWRRRRIVALPERGQIPGSCSYKTGILSENGSEYPWKPSDFAFPDCGSMFIRSAPDHHGVFKPGSIYTLRNAGPHNRYPLYPNHCFRVVQCLVICAYQKDWNSAHALFALWGSCFRMYYRIVCEVRCPVCFRNSDAPRCKQPFSSAAD